jgi:hypothetical protein
MSTNVDLSRPLEETNDTGPPSKRIKLIPDLAHEDASLPSKIYDVNNLLPPSTSLLGRHVQDGYMFQGSEKDVGITEYISHDVSSIEGIIKQRCVSFGAGRISH